MWVLGPLCLMKLFQMDGVLELYPLELEELAGVGYAFGKIGIIIPVLNI